MLWDALVVVAVGGGRKGGAAGRTLANPRPHRNAPQRLGMLWNALQSMGMHCNALVEVVVGGGEGRGSDAHAC